MEQARVVAAQLVGSDSSARYQGQGGVIMKVMGIDVASIGNLHAATAQDQFVESREPKRGQYKKVALRDRRVVGAILLGDLSAFSALNTAFELNAKLSDAEHRRPDRAQYGKNQRLGPSCLTAPDAIDTACPHCAEPSAGALAPSRAGSGCGAIAEQDDTLRKRFAAERLELQRQTGLEVRGALAQYDGPEVHSVLVDQVPAREARGQPRAVDLDLARRLRLELPQALFHVCLEQTRVGTHFFQRGGDDDLGRCLPGARELLLMRSVSSRVLARLPNSSSPRTCAGRTD